MRRALVFAAIALIAGTAYATDPGEQVGDHLEAIIQHVSRGHGRDGERELKAALGLVSKVKAAVAAYEKAAGDDRAAEKKAEAWKALLPHLEDALEKLIELEKLRHRWDSAPAKCKEVTAALRKMLADWGRARSSNEAKKNLAEARKETESIGAGLKLALRELEKDLSAAGRLKGAIAAHRTSDAVFKPVFAEIEDAGELLLDHATTLNEDTKDACQHLALGADNPVVKDAVAKLERMISTSGDLLADARADYERFKAALSELSRWHDGVEAEIRDALCDAEEDPATDVILDGAVARLMARHADRLRERLSELDPEAAQLETRFKGLKETRAAAEIARKRTSMNRAAKNGLFRGTNHPVIRARVEIGKDEHLKMQQHCDAMEVHPPGSSHRIDCVNFESGGTCWIIEIKPDTKRGKAVAAGEAKGYEKEIQDAWSRDPKSFQKGDAQIFLKCVEDHGALVTKSKGDWYQFCPAKVEIADFDE